MAESVFSLFNNSHDGNLSVCVDGNTLCTIELERLFGNRYFYFPYLIKEDKYHRFCSYLKQILQSKRVFRPHFDVGLFENGTEEGLVDFITEFFNIKKVHFNDDLTYHHRSHAAGAFYSSGFDEALVISYDGGGNDGTFCVYETNKERPNFEQINDYEMIPFPTKYASMAYFISEIQKKDQDGYNPHSRVMTHVGKVMGLSAYGSRNEDYLERSLALFESDSQEVSLYFLNDFAKDFVLDGLEGKESYDLAFCTQLAFEETFLKRFYKYFDEEKHKNVCLTGGGALNVVLNERLTKKHPNTNFFVPCSPGDTGISYGMMAGYLKDQIVPELMYTGCPILDKGSLRYILDQRPWKRATPELIARELEKGKIIGVCRGDSETGPRALGNRSILADPRSHKAKDIINNKVKFREWFRPFAPICKEEKASIYFETSDNACYKYMSFSPSVREEYRKQLPAVTHIDGSSRLQTVSMSQNKFIYEVLNSFEELTDIPVLVNTSFNTRGRAILTRYLEAIKVLDSTGLDGVVLGDYYIYK